MKNKITLYLLVLLTVPYVVFAQESDPSDRDPFAPFVWEKPAAVEVREPTPGEMLKNNPLTSKPLSTYRVTGLIVSPTNAIAVIKTRTKHEYFANLGDPLGIEGGIIGVIDSDGVIVDINGKLVTINVSNRFEIQNESN